MVRCVHGDSVFYLLCNGRIKVHVTGTPGSSCRVRYSTHFCTDVEELGELLWTMIVAGSTQSLWTAGTSGDYESQVPNFLFCVRVGDSHWFWCYATHLFSSMLLLLLPHFFFCPDSRSHHYWVEYRTRQLLSGVPVTCTLILPLHNR